MDTWHLWRNGPGEPAWNMALDEALLLSAAEIAKPLLRLYAWNQPAATFGYFQKISDIEAWTSLRPLIRRPTGGGLVPHDRDWTYSVVFPPGHYWFKLPAEESYRRVHQWIAESFSRLRLSATLAQCCSPELAGRCFAGAEKFDVLVDGSKIAGAAQRRNKHGLLIQGSVQSIPPMIERNAWENSMVTIARDGLNVDWSNFIPSNSLLSTTRDLVQNKYSLDSHNRKRE